MDRNLISKEFFQVIIGKKILFVHSKRSSRNYLQITVQEFFVAISFKSVRRNEEISAAARHPVSGLDEYLVVTGLELQEFISFQIPSMKLHMSEGHSKCGHHRICRKRRILIIVLDVFYKTLSSAAV